MPPTPDAGDPRPLAGAGGGGFVTGRAKKAGFRVPDPVQRVATAQPGSSPKRVHAHLRRRHVEILRCCPAARSPRISLHAGYTCPAPGKFRSHHEYVIALLLQVDYISRM